MAATAAQAAAEARAGQATAPHAPAASPAPAAAVGALALAHRRRQALIGAVLARRVAAVWKKLANPAKIDDSWPIIRQQIGADIARARAASAKDGADFYRHSRIAAGLPDVVAPEPEHDLDPARLTHVLDVMGPPAFKRAIAAGQTPPQAIDSAATQLAGAATYMALEGGRQVVEGSMAADGDVLGYQRVTDGDPCAFCAMLASRGPVYKTAATAGDPRGGGNPYHDHCSCVATPVFSYSQPLVGLASGLYDQWLQVTSGTSGAVARRTWRRYWDNRSKG